MRGVLASPEDLLLLAPLPATTKAFKTAPADTMLSVLGTALHSSKFDSYDFPPNLNSQNAGSNLSEVAIRSHDFADVPVPVEPVASAKVGLATAGAGAVSGASGRNSGGNNASKGQSGAGV